MYHASNEKWKRPLPNGMELPNQDKIWTFVEKETYKYSGILEADTIKKKKGERKRTCQLWGSVDASIQQLKDYIEKHEGGLITAIRNNTDNTMANRMTITRKHKWKDKQPYRHFKRLINNISLGKTWTWLRKGNRISPKNSTKQH